MKVLMLTGSPHENGTSAYLAEYYVAGLMEAGHSIVIMDTAAMDIRPCSACDYCITNKNGCAYKDDMEKINPHLIEADRIVLVTPLYYYGMTAQLKRVIDRFYAVNAQLLEHPKELDLLAVCGDADDWAMDALVSHYETIARYLHWRCLPPLLAYGYFTRADIEKSNYAEQARAKAKGHVTG